MGPRTGLNGFRKSFPHRDSIPGLSSPYLVAIMTELSRPTLRNPYRITSKYLQIDTFYLLKAPATVLWVFVSFVRICVLMFTFNCPVKASTFVSKPTLFFNTMHAMCQPQLVVCSFVAASVLFLTNYELLQASVRELMECALSFQTRYGHFFLLRVVRRNFEVTTKCRISPEYRDYASALQNDVQVTYQTSFYT